MSVRHVTEVRSRTARGDVAAEVGTFGEGDTDQSDGDERVGESRSDRRATPPASSGD